MTKTSARTYSVKTTDFPIQIEIRARSIDTCDAVPSDVHVTQDGVLVKSVPVVVSKPDKITRTYSIAKPSPNQDCRMSQAVPCFFPDDAPDDARYDFTISAANGDVEKTTARVPTINPNFVNLTFEYKS